MKDTMAALQSLMSGGWCARRKAPPATMTMKQEQGPAKAKTLSPVIDKQTLSPGAPVFYPVNNEKGATPGSTATKLLPAMQRLSPAAKVFVPEALKAATSDSDKSTACGSGDYTESDNCLFDSGSDIEVDLDKLGTLAASIAPPPGLSAPPGLDLPGLGAPPGLEHPGAGQATQLEMPSSQSEKTPLTRLNSQATPFVPGFSKKSAPPNAKKISISSELDKTGENPTNNPGKFIGATQHLQQSLAQLKGALAEWEACMPAKDAPVSQHLAAAQVSKDLPLISSLMEASAVASTVMGTSSSNMEMLTCNQPQWSPQGVEANTPWLGMAAPAWPVQESWQSGPRYKNWNGPKHQPTPATRMTAEELPADTLRTNLRELEKMPAECVLIVRRINRLGLESPVILEQHFAKFGTVAKVLVSHSRAKQYYGGKPARVRPAGLGFILMGSAEETTTILSFGREQVINGAVITVQPYETRIHELGNEEEAQEQAEETEDMHFQ